MLPAELIEPERPHRFRREEYDRMVEMGVFDDERVELIRGVIVTMSPNHPAHASPVEALTEMLVSALRGRARVRIQLPLLASDDSEPEPDVAVVALGDYSKVHPSQAFLIVEVADSSLKKDRLVKGPLYAASGVREYWIVDVRGRLVEVHRGPQADGWASITRHGHEETLAVESFPDVTVRIADVLR